MCSAPRTLASDEEESLKRVYIALGMAVHVVQLVERELALVLLNPKLARAKRLPTPDEIMKMQEEVDRMTFGQLLRRLKRAAKISPGFEKHLDEGLRKRNYVIHHFFDFYGAEMCIASGRDRMIADLEAIQKLLHPLYTKFHDLSYQTFKAWGMTDQQIQRKIDQMEADFEVRRKTT